MILMSRGPITGEPRTFTGTDSFAKDAFLCKQAFEMLSNAGLGDTVSLNSSYIFGIYLQSVPFRCSAFDR